MSITYTTARRKKICEYALKYGKMKAYELYGVSRPSIDRWLKRYDGTKASLKDYSRRPKSHPNQSTAEEIKLIVDLWHKNKKFGLDYLYGKLKREHGYKRCRETVFNVLRREKLIYKPEKKKEQKPIRNTMELQFREKKHKWILSMCQRNACLKPCEHKVKSIINIQ